MVDPQLRGLLRQGERALRLGKLQAAEAVYRQATEGYPDSAEAWAGLSRSAADQAERAVAAERARALDPLLPVDGGSSATPSEPALEGSGMSLDQVAAESSRWLQEATGAPFEPVVRQPPPAVEPAVQEPPKVEAPEATVCFYHPDRETSLRCNRCDKPICTRCAVKTPVGYRCKTCIKDQQETFYSALWYDYLLAAVVALPMAAVASYIIYRIGWMTIFVAPFAGMLIGEAVRVVTRRRRGRPMPWVVVACIVLGSLPGVGVWLLDLLFAPAYGGGLGIPLGDLFWQLVYLALAVSSAYYVVR